jgi:hypothetical protein
MNNNQKYVYAALVGSASVTFGTGARSDFFADFGNDLDENRLILSYTVSLW